MIRLPHAPPALLVRRVLERTPDGAVVEGFIPSDSPFAEGDTAPAWLALELGAQAAAACAPEGGDASAPRGFVVGVREARFARDTLPVGVPLAIRVRAEGAAGGLAVHAIAVEGVEAVISVYVP